MTIFEITSGEMWPTLCTIQLLDGYAMKDNYSQLTIYLFLFGSANDNDQCILRRYH